MQTDGMSLPAHGVVGMLRGVIEILCAEKNHKKMRVFNTFFYKKVIQEDWKSILREKFRK